MTTNKEALDKIFEAALREVESPIPSPQQARRRQITPRTLEATAAINAVLITPPPKKPSDR